MISKLGYIELNSCGALVRASELCDKARGLSPGELRLGGELCVSGYEYLGEDFETSLIKNLQAASKPGALLGFTHFNGAFNEFILLSHEKIIYKQSKFKLFTLNSEQDKFSAGSVEDIKLFEVGGVKIGVLICFELRFLELWERLKGADIVLIPALWGAKRGEDFKVLSQALALQNRCYVVACSDRDLKFGCVYAPNGEANFECEFDPNLASKFKTSLGIVD